MAQLGTFSKHDIPIFEKSDVEHAVYPVWMQSEGKHGYLNMVPIQQADKPCVVAHHPTEGILGSSNQSSQIVENFESGSLGTRWGDLSTAEEKNVTKQAALTGTYGLDLYGGVIQSEPGGTGTDLPNYPEHGNIIEFYMKAHSDLAYVNTYFCFEDTNNCYQSHFAPENNRWQIWRMENGNKTVPVGGTATINGTNWHRVRMELDPNSNGTIAGELVDVNEGVTKISGSGSETGAASLAKGIRLAVDNTHRVYYDGIRRTV